ncbi:Purine permease [Penicillium frequentans]|uniref:Purine permease n=1 Tax=Penicillium frequentans TaxID=3151616 RepID=A0AAD6GM69_9EURO|nr:Purine permease [Penicillium glabrum]
MSLHDGPMDAPDQIGPVQTPKRTIGEQIRRAVKTFTTKDGLIGNYNYAYLFKPNLPFMKKSAQNPPFFGLNDRLPIALALLLGLQHSLAMLAGIITPPIIIAGYANFDDGTTQYLVSAALIVSGFLSAIQITRFHIPKTPYYLGTGLISVVGTSFSTIPIATSALSQMYSNGVCPTADDGTQLPCPEGYGKIIGTAALCGLLEIGLSFLKPSLLQKLFPPIVTGPTVTLIGIALVQTGLEDWAGGAGSCLSRPSSGSYMFCPDNSAPHALTWGSAQFIGLGFVVFLTIVLCERFGSPIMKSTSVIMGLLIGSIVAAATGYFDRSSIDAAPVANFVWVQTFKLSVYGPLILPFLALYLVLIAESIGDVTATCDVSRLQVEGKNFDSRIQGGILADGLNGILACLCTITPMSTFAQNNGVIALTRCANRSAGYFACFFLVIMGIFSKFAAALVAIPSPVLGGLTTFLFSSVVVSGIRIISTVPFTRRTRFILTASMSVGIGAVLVPTWFSYVFTYEGDNRALLGFFDAIVIIMETGFAVTAFLSIVLNLIMPPEDVEEETESLAGDLAEEDENVTSQELTHIHDNVGQKDNLV